MQPIIGITMSFDKNDLIRKGVEYSFIRREYGEQVRAAGGQPIFLELSIAPLVAAELCDGIIISGGEDIDPRLYGQKPKHIGNTEPIDRTNWERKLIDACDRYRVPILGICYGQQLLNVHYGGTLYQDIAKEYGSSLDHGSSSSQTLHKVTFEQNHLGYKRGEAIDSAARHHQAVRDVAKGFEVVARAEDGIIEAIAGRGHFGIQWHAESDVTAQQIYGSFLNECVGRRRAEASGTFVPALENL